MLPATVPNPRVTWADRCLESARALGVGLVLCVAFVGCKEPTGPEREISGERLFYQYCARCHGMDGKGLPEVAGVRDLTDARHMSTLSDDQVRRTIQMGKPPNMPGFGRSFAEPSLRVLTAYVRKLSSGSPGTASPSPTPAPAKAPPTKAPPAPADAKVPSTTPKATAPEPSAPDGTTPDAKTPDAKTPAPAPDTKTPAPAPDAKAPAPAPTPGDAKGAGAEPAPAPPSGGGS